MFAACGNRVVTLHRSRIGHLDLDEKLPAGYFRRLSQAEINIF
jgi:16S rRNA pseudouridine516 synthase